MFIYVSFFNLTLKHEYVLSQFGIDIVIPLLKDKRGNVCNSDNYCGITVSPVITKIFELCLIHKFGAFFDTHELQLGFKKNVGCSSAIFTGQQLVKYFANRGSAVYMAVIDASEAFDRVNHKTLLNKLKQRNVPSCFINTLACWYSKLYSLIRWNCTFSDKFKVTCGVRQGVFCLLSCSTSMLMISLSNLALLGMAAMSVTLFMVVLCMQMIC